MGLAATSGQPRELLSENIFAANVAMGSRTGSREEHSLQFLNVCYSLFLFLLRFDYFNLILEF